MRRGDFTARSSEGAASQRPYEGKIREQIPHPPRRLRHYEQNGNPQ